MKKIAKDQVIYAMSSENKPVLKAHSGDRICFETRRFAVCLANSDFGTECQPEYAFESKRLVKL